MRSFAGLSNSELLALLEDYVEKERTSLAEFIACLSLVDQKLAATEAGFGSLFEYCTTKLRLSEDEACKRIEVARASWKHPELLSYLADGSLTLTGAARLAPSLKRSAGELLSRAQHKTTREIEELVAPLVAGNPKPAKIKPIKRNLEELGPLFEASSESPPPVTRYEFTFEGTPELKEAIERARQLLSNKYPFGQLDGIILEALREWLARHDPLRRPLPKEPDVVPEHHISAWARRLVWKRDGGRCAYRAEDGRRCEARRYLEVDHVVPRALGGPSTPENLRLHCRAHNDLQRRRVLGEGPEAPRAS